MKIIKELDIYTIDEIKEIISPILKQFHQIKKISIFDSDEHSLDKANKEGYIMLHIEGNNISFDDVFCGDIDQALEKALHKPVDIYRTEDIKHCLLSGIQNREITIYDIAQ